MGKKNKKNKRDYYSQQADFTDFKAVSSQDCTGLIPGNPQFDASVESYKQTYDYVAGIKED